MNPNRDPAIRVIRVIPEGHQEQMDRIVSHMNIKDNRPEIQYTCTFCRKHEVKVGAPMKKCAQCKGALYCSKECQKGDWSRHKKICHFEGPSIRRLVDNFFTNPALCGLLQTYCILTFNLTEKLRVDTPLMVRVDVGIEPTDIGTWFTLLRSSLPSTPDIDYDSPIEGMFQINTMKKFPEDVILTETRVESWKQERMRRTRSTQVVLVEFIRSGHHFSWTTTLPIHELLIEKVRKREPWQDISAIYGTRELQLDEPLVLESMNKLIRGDHKNQFKLRTKMTKFDMDVIRSLGQNVGRKEDDSEAVRAMREKAEREKIYRVIQFD
ncbi:hypothetical protein C8R44DRAFT_775409 [Mycena epipterygia]|nr:hypothetical protein C8R44DRAFT_775409 [Mycena epipterygia]